MLMGWIKVHRILLNKPIWLRSTPEQKTILITLLMLANHDESEWEWMGKKFKVNPGQFVTSLDSIKAYCGKGITTQNIRSALKRFEKLEFLTNKSTKTGRMITICNWDGYQITKEEHNKEANSEVTKGQQTGNKEVTPYKKDKKDNNEKIKEYFNIFWDRYHFITGKLKTDKDDAFKYFSKLTDKERQKAFEMIQLYSKSAEKQYLKKARTYLSDKNFNDEFNKTGESVFNDPLGRLEATVNKTEYKP